MEHHSDILITFKKRILDSTQSYKGQGAKEQQGVYLELLGVALFSSFNVKQAVELGLHLDLIDIITEKKDSNVLANQESQENSQNCFSQLLHNKDVVLACLNRYKFASWMARSLNKTLKNVRSYKSLFALFQKFFRYHESAKILVRENPLLANQLIKKVEVTSQDIDILELNLLVAPCSPRPSTSSRSGKTC